MRKLLLSALTGAFFFLSSAAAGDPQIIEAQFAKNHIGQHRVVCGSVTEVRQKEYGTFIQLGGSYVEDRHGRNILKPDFTAVIWQQDMAMVEINPIAGITSDMEYCFSGEIQAYRHPAIYRYYGLTPQVTLRTADQWFLRTTNTGT
ncbi:MAG TPA: hypothetical protein EYQ00_09485 [Dehalococcoidia bacterium]|jgi:succinyl-CoA synthetase beta subunit|nr:hypothetical protein [Dehalococcoidia bacterium]